MLNHVFQSETKPERVMILGASGFISTYLQQLLQKEEILFKAISSKDIDLIQEGASSKLSKLLLSGDVLVFTSALTPDKGRDQVALMKNLRMAENVYGALKQKSCAHVIYISSDAVYDGSKIPIQENSSRIPTDLYGLMHTGREMMMNTVTAEQKIPCCVLRPCAVYGPGDTHNSYGPNRFSRMAIKDKVIKYFGGGEEQRDHVFVEDVAKLILKCILKRNTGVLNLASGEAVPFCMVAELVKKFCPFDVAIAPQPRSGGGTIVHRPFDAKEVFKTFPDFKFTSIEVGVEKTVQGMISS